MHESGERSFILKNPLFSTATQAPASTWLTPFEPRRRLRNGHMQTIAGNFLRRVGPAPGAPEPWTVVVEPAHGFAGVDVPETRVLCLCHWQDQREQRLTVVLLHGLEGSASSGYILGNAARLWASGCNVVRMNMRSCGSSDVLAPTIYHSGRSEDVRAVVDALRELGLGRIAVVGYSMGANLVLRYAGMSPAADAFVGVSPLMDLRPSSNALHLLSNRFYERRFLRAMKRRLHVKARLFPTLYSSLEREGVYRRIRTMRDFDGEIVARFGGFADADDYYETVRSSRYAGAFRAPTLILHAEDDPFIRMLPATRAALEANPYVDYVETARGGHCAFLAEPSGEDGGRWAEETLARWLVAKVGL